MRTSLGSRKGGPRGASLRGGRLSSRPPGSALLATGVLLLAAALFVYFVAVAWPFTVDDSFITFRYSANLAAGHGPTFNPGLAPVEGYTSFLWMLLMAIPHALGIDAVAFSKWLGCACMLGVLVVSWRFAARLAPGDGPLAGAVAVFMLAASHAAAVHAVSGMETALYALALQLFFYRLVVACDAPTPARLAVLPALGLWVGLTRPEGNLAVALGLLAAFAGAPAAARASLLRRTAGLLLLPGAAYFLWRLHYYGVPLPLPFYVTGHFGTARPGTEAVAEFLGRLIVPLGGLFLLGLGTSGRRLLPALVPAAALIVFYLFPVHRMAYSFRYLFPVLPLLCVTAAAGVPPALRWLRARPRSPRLRDVLAPLGLAAILLVVIWGFLGGLLVWGVERSLNVSRFYAATLERTHIALGRKLAALRPEDRMPVVALVDAGAVPYYSGWRVVDVVGLNDARIARSGVRDPEYILSYQPDLVIFNSRSRTSFEPRLPWDQELHDACVRAGMEKVAVAGGRFYALWILGRPGSEIARELAAWKPGRPAAPADTPPGYDREFR